MVLQGPTDSLHCLSLSSAHLPRCVRDCSGFPVSLARGSLRVPPVGSRLEGDSKLGAATATAAGVRAPAGETAIVAARAETAAACCGFKSDAIVPLSVEGTQYAVDSVGLPGTLEVRQLLEQLDKVNGTIRFFDEMIAGSFEGDDFGSLGDVDPPSPVDMPEVLSPVRDARAGDLARLGDRLGDAPDTSHIASLLCSSEGNGVSQEGNGCSPQGQGPGPISTKCWARTSCLGPTSAKL